MDYNTIQFGKGVTYNTKNNSFSFKNYDPFGVFQPIHHKKHKSTPISTPIATPIVKSRRIRKATIVPEERRCVAICLTGKQCSKKSQEYSEYCSIHNRKFKQTITLDEERILLDEYDVPVTSKNCCMS